MVLESLTDRLGGKQARRVIDLVDDLWDSRKKIVDMVDFVWDNRSAISGVIDFMSDNQDRLADLVGRLPQLVSTTGAGLEAAGVGAERASLLLVGDGDNSPKQLSASAANALERCQEELVGIAELLVDLGDGLDRVNIPTISTDRTEVMGFSLISGIDIGERPLLDGAAKRVTRGATSLGDVAENLGDVANRFRLLGDQLVEVGADLGESGTQLVGSGATMQSFVTEMPDGPRPTPASRRTSKSRKAAAKSTSASKKKTTSKKTATKKNAAAKKKTTSKKSTGTKKRAAKKTSSAKKKAATKKAPRSTIMPGG